MAFYFSYTGSKRLDLKFFEKYIDIQNVSTIVEPFCGSSAFSFYCFDTLKYDKNFYLNDSDSRLIKFLNTVKEKKGIKYFVDKVNALPRPATPEEYKKNCSNEDYGYYYSCRIYGLRKNIMPPADRSVNVDIKKYEKFDKFYLNKNVTLKHGDYSDVFEKYKNDEKAFIFLDPPYLDSFNAYYQDYKTVDKVIQDNTKIFIDILTFIKECKSKVMLIINKNAITEHLYKDYIRGEYSKLYQLVKKKTKHLIITNYNMSAL